MRELAGSVIGSQYFWAFVTGVILVLLSQWCKYHVDRKNALSDRLLEAYRAKESAVGGDVTSSLKPSPIVQPGLPPLA